MQKQLLVTVTCDYSQLLKVEDTAFGAQVLHLYHTQIKPKDQEDHRVTNLTADLTQAEDNRDYYMRQMVKAQNELKELKAQFDKFRADLVTNAQQIND